MAEKFNREELDLIVNDYLSRLKTKIKVDQAILFGSYAKGTANGDSDIDLLIVSQELPVNKPKGANLHPEKLLNPITKSFFEEIFRTGISV